MNGPHCCSVALIVVGPDLDPDAVTAALGWAPDRSWRRGERKRATHPDGRQRVFDSVHDCGGWKRFLSDTERAQSLQDQFDLWLEQVRKRKEGLGILRRHGWRPELDCFAATTEFLPLPHELLAELASLGLDLAMTFSADAGEPGFAPDGKGG